MGLVRTAIKRGERGMVLSQEELDRLTRESVDPNSWGTDASTPSRSYSENSCLSDDELVAKIERRNRERKPTYKLRLEYKRRLLVASSHDREEVDDGSYEPSPDQEEFEDESYETAQEEEPAPAWLENPQTHYDLPDFED
jgi:hypothetical protein